jgi:hypothetical protein
MEDRAMTATKAVAGGVAANVVTVILWGISNVPGWDTVPDEPKAAILGLVSAAVGALIVYLAPANRETVPATVPERGRERSGAFRPGTVLATASE